MPLEVNKHVQRIRRYQPFDVDTSEMIYELQADWTQSLFPVVTLDYLQEAIERPKTKTIVLTGDAGHGKTSLCASLLARLRIDAETVTPDVRKAVFRDLSEAGDASRPIGRTCSGRPLFILRDLSELSLQAGAHKLVELLDPADEGVAVICANEGQLRKCVAEDNNLDKGGTGRAKVLVETLTDGIVRGQVSAPDRTVTVINLNYQSVAPENSVAAENKDGLILWVLKQWTTTQWSRWKPCETCDARKVCPILANRNELSDPTRGPQRRAAIRDVFAAAERTGAVVTTRQALSVTSYMLTGGLSCENVHARYQWSRSNRLWQAPHLYHQALFGDRLTQQQRHLVPAFFALRKLDPGKVSRRAVDDRLDPDMTGDFPPRTPAATCRGFVRIGMSRSRLNSCGACTRSCDGLTSSTARTTPTGSPAWVCRPATTSSASRTRTGIWQTPGCEIASLRAWRPSRASTEREAILTSPYLTLPSSPTAPARP